MCQGTLDFKYLFQILMKFSFSETLLGQGILMKEKYDLKQKSHLILLICLQGHLFARKNNKV